MKKTGVFATIEEIDNLKTALSVSGMCLPGGMPMSNPQKEAHRIALKHGLPEIEGYYGIMETGEFVKA